MRDDDCARFAEVADVQGLQGLIIATDALNAGLWRECNPVRAIDMAQRALVMARRRFEQAGYGPEST